MVRMEDLDIDSIHIPGLNATHIHSLDIDLVPSDIQILSILHILTQKVRVLTGTQPLWYLSMIHDVLVQREVVPS